MHIYTGAKLLKYLEAMILLINDQKMDPSSFRALFSEDDAGFYFNVTSNQFKRIKHYLASIGLEKGELWTNPLFEAICLRQWSNNEKEETGAKEYLAAVDAFYKPLVQVKNPSSKVVALSDIRLFELGIRTIVIAEMHGTQAPLILLRNHIEALARAQATVLIEGLSLEEIEEINYCNLTRSCSLFLYLLIPVERSMRGHLAALEKRQLVSSLISAGIKLIPGENKYSVNLPPTEMRVLAFNYSALQNSSLATPGKPIVFLVGKAHAVDYEHYQGIASILGALLVDLSGPQPLVSLPLLMEKGEAQALVLAHNFFVSKPVSEEDELKSNVGKSTQTSHLSLRQ